MGSDSAWRKKRRKRDVWIPAARLRRLLADANPDVRSDVVHFAGNTSPAGWRLVVRTAFHDPDAEVREKAAYTLSFSFDNDWVLKPLLGLYCREGEAASVRAQAAEGFANLLTYARPQVAPLYKPAVRALVAGLSDSAPEVRFWSAFALGQMRAKSAASELRRVAENDEGYCPGWWRVADEASDALAYVEGRDEDVPQRENEWQRSKREVTTPP